jgi:hypothetical protein
VVGGEGGGSDTNTASARDHGVVGHVVMGTGVPQLTVTLSSVGYSVRTSLVAVRLKRMSRCPSQGQEGREGGHHEQRRAGADAWAPR